nr:MAG TPA: hypothetical protein [Caudoviricetes sp.]
MSKKVKLVGLLLVGGLLLSGSLALNNDVKAEEPKEKFVLSENAIEESRLVKISKIEDNITVMQDLVGNEFEVATTTDYCVGDTWFLKVDRDGIKEVYRKNNLDSSSELAHNARVKRVQSEKNL